MILIVEGFGEVVHVIQAILQRAGFSVIIASNGQEALALFRKHSAKINLMLVAITVPAMSGPQFVNSIPTLKARIPVLFMTTRGEAELATVAEQGFPLLCKPFTEQMLIEAVAALTANSG